MLKIKAARVWGIEVAAFAPGTRYYEPYLGLVTVEQGDPEIIGIHASADGHTTYRTRESCHQSWDAGAYLHNSEHQPSPYVYADNRTGWLCQRQMWWVPDQTASGKNVWADDVELAVKDLLRREKKDVERSSARLAVADGSASTVLRKPIPDDVKMFVWQRDGGACVQCGSRSDLEFDHIIPLTMGGANTARNLQLLCQPCNHAKGGNLA